MPASLEKNTSDESLPSRSDEIISLSNSFPNEDDIISLSSSSPREDDIISLSSSLSMDQVSMLRTESADALTQFPSRHGVDTAYGKLDSTPIIHCTQQLIERLCIATAPPLTPNGCKSLVMSSPPVARGDAKTRQYSWYRALGLTGRCFHARFCVYGFASDDVYLHWLYDLYCRNFSHSQLSGEYFCKLRDKLKSMQAVLMDDWRDFKKRLDKFHRLKMFVSWLNEHRS